MPGQIGEKRKVRLNSLKFYKALLVSVLFSLSMLYLSTAKAGDVQWSINLGWLFSVPHNPYPHHPVPNHGHGHGHSAYVDCVSYYMSHGCNQYGYNCVRYPQSQCVNGRFVGPYVIPPQYDHHGTVHVHSPSCYQPHWHGHMSHTHHTNGHQQHWHGDR